MTAPSIAPVSARRVAREFARYRSGRVVHPELEDVSLFVDLVLDWSPAELDEVAALLLFIVQDPPSRDAVMLQWATDFEMGDTLWRLLRQPAGIDLEWDQRLANLLAGVGPRPDPGRVERGLAIVERLAAVASEQHRWAPLHMAAWLTWARSNWSSA